MEILERKIGDLIGVSVEKGNMIRVDKDRYSFILRKKDSNNFMLFIAHKASYIYVLIVRCEKKYEEKLRQILLDVCDDIEEDYGEDHRREVRDILFEADNRLSTLEEQYKITEMFGLDENL